MADKRIKDLGNEATSATLDANQYAVVDGSTGTFKTKLSAISDWIHGRWASFVNALTAKTSFASGDKIAVVNGSTATAMGKDDLLQETAQNAVAALNGLPQFTGTYRIYDTTTPQRLQNFVTTEGQTNTARYRARNSVPVNEKKSGMVLSYRLDSIPVSEYILHSSSSYSSIFNKDQYWFELGGKRILKDASAYYYNNNAVALDNYLKDVICSENLDLHLFFSLGSTKKITCYLARFVNGSYVEWVGKVENLQITSERETLSSAERIAMTKYRDSDPDIVLVLDTLRISQESFESFQIGSTSSSSEELKNSGVVVSVVASGNSDGVGNFNTVFGAVASHQKGLCSVGSAAGVVLDDNVTIPLYSSYFIAKTINDAFSISLDGMNKIPMLQNVELVRQKYNDTMLYVTTCSRDRIYFSYAPRKNEYSGLTEFESRDMFYLDKDNMNDLVRIEFPQYMTGGQTNVVGRKHGFFELSNGDALVEVENGTQVNSLLRHINLYKISAFRSKQVVDGVVTIDNSDLSIVCTFVNNANLTSFHSFEEYDNGKIIMAPYGSGKTARVYISSDYGSSFSLIFCGDTDNAENIPVKYAVTGDGTGAWPTEDHLLGDTIDWTKTLNGNIHVHGIAYDKYYDRIWVVTGDGVQGADSVTGIWWTDDLGTTWHKYGCRKAQEPFNAHGTQMIDIVPMPKCVLFATDGEGDGLYRWNRSGKNGNFVIEGCYQFIGEYHQLWSLGGKYCVGDNGIVYQLWHPNNSDDVDFVGGIVATLNGYDVDNIYSDQFATPGNVATAEIYWNCCIHDFGDKLIIGAKNGGYIIALL